MPQLICNIGDLVTIDALALGGALGLRRRQLKEADLGRRGPHAWLAISEGKVLAYGDGEPSAAYRGLPRFDAGGGLVMPGLVDAHTHLLFAGSRAGEFWQRASGATYQEIAARGGGIRASMLATRAASDDELEALVAQRLRRALGLGITTLEIKSGYGLSAPAELRLLRLLHRVKNNAAQRLSITCLALHAASPEHADNQSYAEACCRELLPLVAAEGLAEHVDAFVEAGYFSGAEVEPYAKKARQLGLSLRLHADEFTDSGGAAAAAAWGARSADHLQFASADGIAAMAEAGVTATLLPGTSLYTKIPFTDARRFTRAGVPVAIATDFNPGSCLLDNLAQLATVACIHNGLAPAEVIAAVTYVAAASLGLGAEKGSLAPGYDADFCLYAMPNAEAWLADSGRTPPREVWLRGEPSFGVAF